MVCTVRKWRQWMDVFSQCLPFDSVWNPSSWNDTSTKSENSLPDTQACLLGESRACQVDNHFRHRSIAIHVYMRKRYENN